MTWRRLVRWAGLFSVSTCVFVAACNWWVMRSAAPYLHERADAVSATANAVAIVPGARVYGTVPSPILRDRLQTALELHKAGVVSKILVSGDHGTGDYDEVGAMRAWLEAHGVPDDDITVDHAGFRTLDTMKRAHDLFHVERAVICTQRFHLARAVFLARQAGIDAHGVVADHRLYPGRHRDQVREVAARTMAVIDTYLLKRAPRYSRHLSR